MATQNERLTALESALATQNATLATLADSMAKIAELVTTAPIPQASVQTVANAPAPKASTKNSDKKAADPKAEFNRVKRELKKARETAEADYGFNSVQHVNATCDYRDHFIAGFNSGLWSPTGGKTDVSSFWTNTVLGTWSRLERGTVPTPVKAAKREPRMPTPNPTADKAVANVDKQEHMRLVQESRGHCPSCRNAIMARLPIKSELCDGTYATASGRSRLCITAEADQTNADILPDKKAGANKTNKSRVVNLDTVDAESAADRAARLHTQFLQSLSPAERAAYCESVGVSL